METQPLWNALTETDRRLADADGSIDTLLSVSKDRGVVPYNELFPDRLARSETHAHYKCLDAGAIVLNKMSAATGAIGVADRAGIVSPDYSVFVPRDGNDARFLVYVLGSADFCKNKVAPILRGIGVGDASSVRTPRVGTREYLSLPIPFFSLQKQRRIADYLDRETAEIDAAVADLDRYVELLEKRRRAVIYEALAFKKGPGSGTQISAPQRGRVGFVARLLRRGISPDYVDDGMPVINQKCIRPGGFLAMDNCRFHDLDAREISSNLTIQPGDTLINSTGTGTLGRSCMVREATVPTAWDSHVTLVRPDTEIVDPGYLGWTILSQESKLIEFSAGSTNQIELSRDTVFNLDFVNIPLILQREIAAYLDHETAEIDSLIADSTSLRDLLVKRRSVLITEVVTGRKQV